MMQVWDASSITLLQTCKRKFYYRRILHLEARDKSIHLLFGSAFASAVEHYYKLLYDGAEPEDALHHVVYRALIASTGWPADRVKNRKTLIRSIIHYIDEYHDIDAPCIHESDGRPALEQNFVIPLSDEITLTGNLDRVISRDGMIYIMDQKTTKGSVSDAFFSLFTPDNQMSMYSMAGKMLYNTPIKGVIVDAIGISPERTQFSRGIIHRDEQYLDEWLRGIRQEIRAAQQLDPANPLEWPQNPAACGYYSGCEYRQVCSLSPAFRKAALDAAFVHSEWKPLEGRSA